MTKHQKKLKRFEIAQQPRFLTFSCYKRLPLFQNDKIKDAFVERLHAARIQTGFRLLAWVIMPEHVHLIVVPQLPEFPLSKVLPAIKRPFAEQVIRRWKELNAPVLQLIQLPKRGFRFWQHGGGYDRNVRDEAELFEKIEYYHGNPWKRGLVTNPLEWRWSSARWYARQGDIMLELDSLYAKGDPIRVAVE